MNKYVQLKKKHDDILNSKEWMTKDFFKAIDDYEKEFNKHIKSDKDGTGFIYDYFIYELPNHEWIVMQDDEHTLYRMEFTLEKVLNDPALSNGFELAKKEILTWDWN